MKKYVLMLLVAAMGLMTACKNEVPVNTGEQQEEELVTIAVNAPQQGLITRTAGSTAFADPALAGMRVALIISSNNKVIMVDEQTNHDFGTDGKTAAIFKVRLVKGQAYDITAWADFGSDYYTLPTPPSGDADSSTVEPIVKLAKLTRDATTKAGSSNLYDCYFKNESKTISANERIYLELKRPVALVKINTTDWNEASVKYSGYRPNSYNTIISANTQLNVITGVADSIRDITIKADVVAYDCGDMNPKELNYEYLFANTDATILSDFTVNYTKGEQLIADYTFNNIPVQRNYKTNIVGNILTKVGDIYVTLDNNWNTPDTTIEVGVVAKIGSVSYEALDLAIKAVQAGQTIEILSDINGGSFIAYDKMGGSFTIKGNNHTISNLNIQPSAAGCAGLVGYATASITINDLIVKNCTMTGKYTTEGDEFTGAAAFIGLVDVGTTNLKNCQAINNTISGAKYSGGMVGYTSGCYTMDSITVSGSTITSAYKGAGAVFGFCAPGQAPATGSLNHLVVKNNSMSSATTKRVGVLYGRINAGVNTLRAYREISGNKVNGQDDDTTLYGEIGNENQFVLEQPLQIANTPAHVISE